MNKRENLISRYFNGWLEKDPSILTQAFSQDVYYSECYGPVYRGLEQVCHWFQDWNQRGSVLRWDIRGLIHQGNTYVCEWFFQCLYDDNPGEFDGVSIIAFDDDDKIVSIKEFRSDSDHYEPYGDQLKI